MKVFVEVAYWLFSDKKPDDFLKFACMRERVGSF